jgi:hypothetical protein
MTVDPRRSQEIAAFYARHQRNLERIVNRQVRAPGTIVEDACQTAWTRLCAHPDVTLEEHCALSWLVTTAIREAWNLSQRLAARETPAGAFRTTSDVDPLELAEPAAEHASPCDLAIAHAEHEQRVHRLRALTHRERLYVYLQGLGYSYTEMAQSTAASRRTVERQVSFAHARSSTRARGVKHPRLEALRTYRPAADHLPRPDRRGRRARAVLARARARRPPRGRPGAHVRDLHVRIRRGCAPPRASRPVHRPRRRPLRARCADPRPPASPARPGRRARGAGIRGPRSGARRRTRRALARDGGMSTVAPSTLPSTAWRPHRPRRRCHKGHSQARRTASSSSNCRGWSPRGLCWLVPRRIGEGIHARAGPRAKPDHVDRACGQSCWPPGLAYALDEPARRHRRATASAARPGHTLCQPWTSRGS